mgnify:CR=1 FL=1
MIEKERSIAGIAQLWVSRRGLNSRREPKEWMRGECKVFEREGGEEIEKEQPQGGLAETSVCVSVQ